MRKEVDDSLAHRLLVGVMSLLMVSGCLPNPMKNPSNQLGRGGGDLAISARSPVTATLPRKGEPEVKAEEASRPIELAAPIISHNGGNAIHGSVRIPASIISHNGGSIISSNGGSIVSANGGSIVSTNGGSIISSNGGSIISHNGGSIIGNNGASFKISQLPVAHAVVRLKDAAGAAVKDGDGGEIVTQTDDSGNYQFPVDVKGRNLVVHVELPEVKGDLVAFLPKEGVKQGESLDVDVTSTLSLAYVMDLYVRGDLVTFEKLTKELADEARLETEDAIVEKAIALPETLDRAAILTKVAEVRRTDVGADQTFEKIRRKLVVAGVLNEGDGVKAVYAKIEGISGVTTDPQGNIYVFSQKRHTLWKITQDGILHTLVAYGKWGYTEKDPTPPSGLNDYISGIAFDLDGSLLLADTFNHRIVRITADRKLSIVAGGDEAGFAGDGGLARASQLHFPTGLAVDALGNIYFGDAGNHRIRQISRDGKLSTVAGTGDTTTTQRTGLAINSRVSLPGGLSVGRSGDVYFADNAGNRLVKLGTDGNLYDVAAWEFISSSPINKYLLRPRSVAIGEDDSVYMTSSTYNRIVKVSGGSIDIIDPAKYRYGESEIGSTWSDVICLSNGKIIVDSRGEELFSLNSDFSATKLLGASKEFFLESARDIAVDASEIVYVTDSKNIKKINPGGEVEIIAGNGEVRTDKSLYTIENTVEYIRKPYVESTTEPAKVSTGDPQGIALTRMNEIIFADQGPFNVIRQLSPAGVPQW